MSDDEDILYVRLPDSTPRKITLAEYQIHIGDTLTDAARYRWLRDRVIEVLCEGRTSDCYSKWMLPRLMAEDNHGNRYTFDEIIDKKMGGDGI